MKMFNKYLKKCYAFCFRYANKMIQNGLDDNGEFAKDIEDIEYLAGKINQNIFLSNVVALSKDNFYQKDFIFKLNSVPHLLPIKNNKVINLKTLKIRDSAYSDYFTDIINYNYIPNLKINIFENFIQDLFRNKSYSRFFKN